jgi:hypothetical protein
MKRPRAASVGLFVGEDTTRSLHASSDPPSKGAEGPVAITIRFASNASTGPCARLHGRGWFRTSDLSRVKRGSAGARMARLTAV